MPGTVSTALPARRGNITYVHCRVDLCAAAGWLIDHKGSYGDATKLVGCSTERSLGDGAGPRPHERGQSLDDATGLGEAD